MIGAKMKHFETKVIENKQIVSNFFLLSIEYPLAEPNPGQFINIQAKPYLLKRPFAIFDYEKGKLSILYRVVGDGTTAMTDLVPGDKVEVLAPLGNSFPMNEPMSVVIAGGTGIAPVYYFLKTLKNPKKAFIGVNHQDEAAAFETLFAKIYGSVSFSTMDGCYGFKGNAVDMAVKALAGQTEYTLITCGPHAMFDSIYHKIQKKELRPKQTFVSLEARMGCGFGVCQGCAVEKKDLDQFFYVCKDGPIFDMNDLKWH